MPGRLEIAQRIFTGSTEIPDGCVRDLRDIDRREITRAHQTGQLDGVTTVGFHPIARLLRDERWGNDLSVVEQDRKPGVRLSHRTITLTVRPGSSRAKREEVMHDWHKALLHEAVPPLIKKWQSKLGVTVSRYFLQRMKTKWGGCNHRARHIRLNTELVKKPKDLLEYVVVHEMLHLIAPSHSAQFVTLLSTHYPAWREARAELNELPLGAEAWKL
jgi:predicted metal-dependent hydrolase